MNLKNILTWIFNIVIKPMLLSFLIMAVVSGVILVWIKVYLLTEDKETYTAPVYTVENSEAEELKGLEKFGYKEIRQQDGDKKRYEKDSYDGVSTLYLIYTLNDDYSIRSVWYQLYYDENSQNLKEELEFIFNTFPEHYDEQQLSDLINFVTESVVNKEAEETRTLQGGTAGRGQISKGEITVHASRGFVCIYG